MRVYWVGFVVRGLFYGMLVALLLPVLFVFRIDERHPGIDDGLGYDDNDPGKDVDGE